MRTSLFKNKLIGWVFITSSSVISSWQLNSNSILDQKMCNLIRTVGTKLNDVYINMFFSSCLNHKKVPHQPTIFISQRKNFHINQNCSHSPLPILSAAGVAALRYILWLPLTPLIQTEKRLNRKLIRFLLRRAAYITEIILRCARSCCSGSNFPENGSFLFANLLQV